MKNPPYPGFSKDAQIVRALAIKHLMPSLEGMEDCLAWMKEHQGEDSRQSYYGFPEDMPEMSYHVLKVMRRALIRAHVRHRYTWGDVIAQLDEMLPF